MERSSKTRLQASPPLRQGSPRSRGVSVLLNPDELRTSLVAEFDAMVHATRAAAASVKDMEDAVHDSRKALRRALALLSVIGSALPMREQGTIKTALQQARRSLSSIRDRSVAAKMFQEMRLSEADRTTAEQVLAHAAHAVPSIAQIKLGLRQVAARAAVELRTVQSALPAQLTWAQISDGVRRLYKKTRRAHRASKDSQEFHRWRRRSKELVYALAFVARHGGPRTAASHHRIAHITRSLGDAVDLIMLRGFVETHGQGLSREAVGHLRQTLDTRLAHHMKIARKSGRKLFALKGKIFARRLTKAIERDRGVAIREEAP